MKRIIATLSIGLLLAISSPACFGKFALAGKLKGAIGSIGNKWVQSLVVLVTIIFPIVLWVTYLLDALIFNLIEFWGGSNPLAEAEYDQNGTAVRTVSKDGVTLRTTYMEYGAEMKIEVFQHGISQGEALHFRQSEPGVIFKKEVTGELSRVSRESLGITDQQYARAQARVSQIKGLATVH